jgi:hypothetical protein
MRHRSGPSPIPGALRGPIHGPPAGTVRELESERSSPPALAARSADAAGYHAGSEIQKEESVRVNQPRVWDAGNCLRMFDPSGGSTNSGAGLRLSQTSASRPPLATPVCSNEVERTKAKGNEFVGHVNHKNETCRLRNSSPCGSYCQGPTTAEPSCHKSSPNRPAQTPPAGRRPLLRCPKLESVLQLRRQLVSECPNRGAGEAKKTGQPGRGRKPAEAEDGRVAQATTGKTSFREGLRARRAQKNLRLCRVGAFENPQFTWVPQARLFGSHY